MKKCPRCGSANISNHEYRGVKCLKCNDCGFDEASEMDMYSAGRTSQKAKGRYSPYKAGGKRRTVKR